MDIQGFSLVLDRLGVNIIGDLLVFVSAHDGKRGIEREKLMASRLYQQFKMPIIEDVSRMAADLHAVLLTNRSPYYHQCYIYPIMDKITYSSRAAIVATL